jgi:hypothetical protein
MPKPLPPAGRGLFLSCLAIEIRKGDEKQWQWQLMQPKISAFFKRQATEPNPNRFVFFPPLAPNP